MSQISSPDGGYSPKLYLKLRRAPQSSTLNGPPNSPIIIPDTEEVIDHVVQDLQRSDSFGDTKKNLAPLMEEARDPSPEPPARRRIATGQNTQAKARAACFTLNNYTEADIEMVRNVCGKARYGVLGKEIAPTTGTAHIQGYIYFTNAKTFNAFKKLLPQGTHIELAVASAKQNREYCTKGGDFEEYGIFPDINLNQEIIQYANRVIINIE